MSAPAGPAGSAGAAPPSAPALPVEDRRLKAIALVLLAAALALIATLAERAPGQLPFAIERFVPFAVVAVVAVNLLAAGVLFLGAGLGAVRTLREPKRRRAVALQLLLANVLTPVLLYALISEDRVATEAHLGETWEVALSLLGTAACVVAWRLWRRSQRHEALDADEAMARDPRPPVLYLRSFRDDGTALLDDGRSSLSRRIVQAIAPPTPEQEMARVLQRVGPVVAIGKPGEPLPELGAARLYVAHADWQRRVAELMGAAALVVVRVGASPGVLWEIEQALALLPRQRLVLAILGGAAIAPELVARLAPVLGASFEAALPQPPSGGWRGLAFRDPRRRIGGLVCFDAAGTARAVPVRLWPVERADWPALMSFRPSAAPLRRAWREVFAGLGLAPDPEPRSRAVAIILALLVGWLGAQWFYLGNRRRGWIYVATIPLLMAPLFVSWIDALRFVWADRREFEARYVSA